MMMERTSCILVVARLISAAIEEFRKALVPRGDDNGMMIPGSNGPDGRGIIAWYGDPWESMGQMIHQGRDGCVLRLSRAQWWRDNGMEIPGSDGPDGRKIIVWHDVRNSSHRGTTK